MKKYLGEILLEKGYLSTHDLQKALAYQRLQVTGDNTRDTSVTDFLLDVARTKYNNRDRFHLGKILTEMKLLPEEKVLEALAIQKDSAPEKSRDRLDALNRIIARMNSSYNLVDLLNQILVLAAQLVEAECASLTIYDHARDALVIFMPTGPGAEVVRDLEVPKGKGIVGWVYAKAQPVICNDAAGDARFYAGIDAASGYTSRQILCVPLTVKDRRLGVIEAINKKGTGGGSAGVFSKADLFLLSMFAAQAAIAIENTRLAVALSQVEEDLSLRSTDVAAAQQAHAGALVAGSFLHQMQKALVPLQGYAARMAETVGDERVEKYRAYIDREMGRLMAHAGHIAQYLSHSLTVTLQPVSLADLFKELESRIWVECRTAGIAFTLEMRGEISVNGDEELLLAVLEEIFHNSRDAMSAGGTFALTVRPAAKACVAIECADTGTGIQATPPDRVFEPFYTGGKPHGAGLGLAMAREIVRLHDGDITASHRAEGGGALLTITLPVL
jgi:signal transduction histidine kinase